MTDNTRTAARERTTRETSINIELNLDGSGTSATETGVGFLDHMLELLARHGGFDLSARATGDLHVDAHHTTEDVGIVLGKTFAEALGDKRGITRYADVRLPMEESLAAVAVDISGRGGLVFSAEFPASKVGEFDVELVEDFWHAFCNNAGVSMHVDLLRGTNTHHMAEAIFKGAARALRAAVARDSRFGDDIPSTKGAL
jgi:imidazoleglycerol-phosphate dehydratase